MPILHLDGPNIYFDEQQNVLASPPKMSGVGEVGSTKAVSVHFSAGLLSPKEKEYLSSQKSTLR